MLAMHRSHYLIRRAVLATLRAEADRHARALVRTPEAHPSACVTGSACDGIAALRGGRGRLVEEEVRVNLDCHGDLHPRGDGEIGQSPAGDQPRSSNGDPTGSNPTPIPGGLHDAS